MIPSVERFIKQAIVDRNQSVASSALTTSIHFYGENRDAIKRWGAEIQQALTSAGSKSVTQYHALALMYLIKQNDKMAMMKLVQQMNGSTNNPMTSCLLVRIYSQLLKIDPSNPLDLKPYLRSKGKSDMVALEAARVICENPSVYSQDLVYAVTGIAIFPLKLFS